MQSRKSDHSCYGTIGIILLATLVGQASAFASPYGGPSPPGGTLRNGIASIELPEHGVVLEVADSTIPAAGRGLFVRCLPENKNGIALPGGTALCGCATGTMQADVTDSEATGSVVAFRLRDPGFDGLDLSDIGSEASPVWFEGSLRTAEELLSLDDVDSIAGHVAVYEDGDIEALTEDDDEWFFRPDPEQPRPDVDQLGVFCNDLAFDDRTAARGYEAASTAANVLAFVFEVGRDAVDPRRLVPLRPITTVMRDVTLTNKEPMELGLAYGSDYWGVADESQAELDELAQWM